MEDNKSQLMDITLCKYDYATDDLLILKVISDNTIDEIQIEIDVLLDYLNHKNYNLNRNSPNLIDEIEEHLSEKVLIINNCNKEILNIIDFNLANEDRFFFIPKLDYDNFNAFYDGEEFELNTFAAPHYLAYNDKIYVANLEIKKGKFVSKDSVDYPLNIELSKLKERLDLIELDNIIFVKKLALFKSVIENKDNINNKDVISEELDKFHLAIRSEGLIYSKEDIYNFYTCLSASELVILAGMSGTGKTQLPLSFAKYFNMSEDKHTLLFVPISPSFLEPSDVIGFLNVNTNKYIPSVTGIVDFLLHAEKHPNKMHMIIFDEMNLAQIEYWFAPFLSIMEQDNNTRFLELYSEGAECDNSDIYPSKIRIGKNIVFVGTVNIDETTKNISDRLKDRSFIINLSKASFKEYQLEQNNNEHALKTNYERDFYSFVKRLDHGFDYIESLSSESLEFLDEVHEMLNDVDNSLGISFRTVKNISHYMHFKPGKLDSRLAFDLAFKQTVLKKLSGAEDLILDIIGEDNENSPLVQIFNKYPNVSSFLYSKKEILIKRKEIRRFGYAK